MTKTFAFIAAVLLAICTLAASGLILKGATTLVQAAILIGQAAPDSNGAVFTGLGRPSINNLGSVAFRGQLTSATVSYGNTPGKISPSGVFLISKGLLKRIASYGDIVLQPASMLTNFGDPVINDSDQIAFIATMGIGYKNQGIFLKTENGLDRVALTGSTAP